MSEYTIVAEKREGLGKRLSRRLRDTKRVPAVVYGGSKQPISVSLEHDSMMRNLDNEAFYANILTVDVAGDQEQVVLKAVQRHPSRRALLHVDFQRVSAKQKLKMNVPIHCIGADIAPGVKQGGGEVSHQMTDVEIACLPANLPEFLEIDMTAMALGDTLHLSDIKLPEGVEILALALGEDHDHPVVSIHAPRAAEAEPEEDVVAEEGEEEGDESPAE